MINEKLEKYLSGLGRLAIAFSGGVDSTFLLSAACRILGKENVLAITARAECVPVHESAEADEFCASLGIKQLVLELRQLEIEGFPENSADRCYICKRSLFTEMTAAAVREGFAHLADGTNASDTGDFRPGLRALAELGILSPLKDCGITKDDIRAMSRELGLPTWNKPSFACLASRFPYGERITAQKLDIVEKAENILRALGFEQYRVRIHEAGSCGFTASVEVMPKQFGLYGEHRGEIEDGFSALGFARTDLDPEGYRTGSLNLV
ncbi:MAG: ATP-dependent sacrificial sulfur transferase LarE [Eubacteriaceae bacterium]|jgi:uncharacterized protein|nr:ATP-dependent sacrificial sulfur transferase LarE [Eubacteriaceae bacterium]